MKWTVLGNVSLNDNHSQAALCTRSCDKIAIYGFKISNFSLNWIRSLAPLTPTRNMADFERVLNSFNLERKDLDFKCQRSIIDSVSGEIIKEWNQVGRAVGVSKIKLTSISSDVNLSPEQKPVAVLDAWVEENGREATCLKLAETLYEQKKINTLEILCEKVKRDAAAAKTSESGAVVSCHPSGSQRQQQGDTKKNKYR